MKIVQDLNIKKLLFLWAISMIFVAGNLHAQVVPDTPRAAETDTIPQPPADMAPMDIPPDGPGAQFSPQDGEMPAQQTAQTRRAERESVPDAVNFQARDSLTFNLRNQRIAHLYGASNVKHQTGELSSGTIELDLNKNQLHANTSTPQDTLSYPVLRQNGQDLRSTRILFNYETEKGKFEAAEIQIDDGFLIGTQVKNVSRTEVFIEDGIYSTCPPDHMYYYIRARRMKVVDEEEIFFTNAQLYILDIPYPLIFPFGYVPAGIDRRRSGLLEPTYAFQNTSARGIGLQNVGWFQYINDHLTAQTSFDVFTSGTFFNDTRFQYRKTGNFNGSVIIGYSSERGLEPTDPGFTETKTRRLAVTHDQQLTPYSNISANINLRSADFFQRNSFNLDERAETSSTSRISYRYNHPEGIYNFSVTSNLNQQFNTNTTRLTGPEMNFSLRQFSPFKSSTPSVGQERWYERVSVNYRNNFRSQYSFVPIDRDTADVNWFQALLNPSLHREATGEDRHIKYGFVQIGRAHV